MTDRTDYSDLPGLPESIEIPFPSYYPDTGNYQDYYNDGVEQARRCIPNKIFTEDQMRAYAAQSIKEAFEKQWQTIDTAPKDGTVILLRTCSDVLSGYYMTNRDVELSNDSTSTIGWKSNETGWDLFDVRYWMPLPELPKYEE